MSKMYPNGGYRNKQALELSMPKQATPPVVSSPRSEPRNNRTQTYNPYNKSTVGLGLADSIHTPTASTSGVTIDLRGFADYHSRDLSWQQTDKLNRGNQYGSGKYSIEIDLKGSNYRVNGRGAIMRAALKLARGIVKGGKRLPKNLYKELILTIVDQILSQLAVTKEFADWTVSTVFRNNANARVWSYDPSMAIFGAGDLEVPGAGYTSLPNGTSPSTQPHTITMGERVLTSVSALPTMTTARLAEWAAAGYAPYHIARDELTNTKVAWLSAGVTQTSTKNLVVGVEGFSVLNSRLIGTWRVTKPGMTPDQFLKLSLRTALSPKLANGPKMGGSSDPYKPVKTDVRFNVPDKKFSMPSWLHSLTAIAFGATELADLIDAFYDALPANRKYGRSYIDKLKRLHQFWDEIDWGKAITNVIWNHYEDKAVGRFQGMADFRLRQTDIGGTSYKYGVTSGGGSSVYTGDIAF